MPYEVLTQSRLKRACQATWLNLNRQKTEQVSNFMINLCKRSYREEMYQTYAMTHSLQHENLPYPREELLKKEPRHLVKVTPPKRDVSLLLKWPL